MEQWIAKRNVRKRMILTHSNAGGIRQTVRLRSNFSVHIFNNFSFKNRFWSTSLCEFFGISFILDQNMRESIFSSVSIGFLPVRNPLKCGRSKGTLFSLLNLWIIQNESKEVHLSLIQLCSGSKSERVLKIRILIVRKSHFLYASGRPFLKL